MATFSYQLHHPLILGSALQNGSDIISKEQDGVMSMTNASTYFPGYHSSNAIQDFSPSDFKPHESSSSLDIGREVMENPVAAVQLQGSEESSKTQSSSEKKRKESNTSYSSSAKSQDAKHVKRKKQKKCSTKEAEDPPDADEGGKKACQEPPACGYIHVRARRGQATDSHSLAERVRREKISERMKLLQGLVPGCDKVIGKALMLDEIINYVQSLQNQVEFLSMKLASVNPTIYDFGYGLEGCMVPQEELGSMSPQPLPSVQQASHIQPTAFPATNDYLTLDTSSAFLLHGPGPSDPLSQEQGSFVMQLGDHREAFLNQMMFNSMCSFH